MEVNIIYKEMPEKIKVFLYQNEDATYTAVCNKNFIFCEEELVKKINYIDRKTT